MIKVQQKVPGGFHTFPRTQIFARLRAYLSTARKNKRNVLEDIVAALEGDSFSSALFT